MNLIRNFSKFQKNFRTINFQDESVVKQFSRVFSANTKKISKSSKTAKPKESENKEESRQDYFELRSAAVQKLKQKLNIDPYPHQFNVTCTIPTYIDRYGHLANGDSIDNVSEIVAGRIYSIREAKKLVFIDLRGDGEKLQVKVYEKSFPTPAEFTIFVDTLRRGDLIGIEGTPSRTKRGELSIDSKKATLLAPCLHEMPTMYYGLKEKQRRYRQRYLDLMFNDKVRKIFETRARAISYIRQYFDSRGFLEVETPMLNAIVGGAAARPFATFHNDMQMQMYMRTAPELYLKMLVVGGLNRVYEIGKQFRNEGIDRSHNPEFTTCEFYMAYADVNDVITMTEELLSGLVHNIHGTYKIQYHPDGHEENALAYELDFTPPFRRIKMMPALEEALNVKFPNLEELGTPESNAFFDNLCKENDVTCAEPRTTSRLLDKLVEKYLESQCINPTLICDFPQIVSPLAKNHRNLPGLTERFELFVMGKELCNAYTELNDPFVQRKQFELQASYKESGDDEAQAIDENFCTALEYGLPPTGGWGIGIDRLIMFLTDTANIKEVQLFPTMRPFRKRDNYDSDTEPET